MREIVNLPNGIKVLPYGTKVLQDGTKVLPDGTIISPDCTIISPDGTITLQVRTIVLSGGTRVYLNGSYSCIISYGEQRGRAWFKKGAKDWHYLEITNKFGYKSYRRNEFGLVYMLYDVNYLS